MKRRCLAYIEKTFPHLEGQSFLITGSSNGIGLEAAKALLLRGAKVTFMVRDHEKTLRLIEAIEIELGKPINAGIAIFEQADPRSIQSRIASL